jgi:hypothetical protein
MCHLHKALELALNKVILVPHSTKIQIKQKARKATLLSEILNTTKTSKETSNSNIRASKVILKLAKETLSNNQSSIETRVV